MAIKDNKPQFIKANQSLRQRAVNFKTGLDLNMTDEVRGLIEKAIDDSKDEFSKDVLEKLREMRDLVKKAETDELQRLFIMGNITELAFDVKGMGGTFGFPLLTHLAKSLHDFLNKVGVPSPEQFDVVRIHIDALYLVLAQGIKGAGGKAEKQLVENLERAISKVMNA